MPSLLPFAISAVLDTMIYGPFALISVTILHRLRSSRVVYRSRVLFRVTSVILLWLSSCLSIELAAFFQAVSKPDQLETSVKSPKILALIILEGMSLLMSFMIMTWRSMLAFPGDFKAKHVIVTFIVNFFGIMPSPFWSGIIILIFWVAISAYLGVGMTVVALVLLRVMSMLLGLVSSLILFSITLQFSEPTPDSMGLRGQFFKDEGAMYNSSLAVNASNQWQRTENATPSDSGLSVPSETSRLAADPGMSGGSSGPSAVVPMPASRLLPPLLPQIEEVPVTNMNTVAPVISSGGHRRISSFNVFSPLLNVLSSSNLVQNQSSHRTPAPPLVTEPLSFPLSQSESSSDGSNNEDRSGPDSSEDHDRYSVASLSYPPSYHTRVSSPVGPNFSLSRASSILPPPPVPPRPAGLRSAPARASDSVRVTTTEDDTPPPVPPRPAGLRSAPARALDPVRVITTEGRN
ncbi:hypothetical protein K435DRAFT_959328 [Dendrothele bispora CBS 962.96]|uniref:Uncharacterized protein n=1 Tax=Dendrothele bispora (strain CBS 962.96) TaxID=1314807 RepID=A0A4S8MYN5_DENBC|nr:hypothetical protein K435DRAFT_959328 [Dendrothele bispora CBS 962.96]